MKMALHSLPKAILTVGAGLLFTQVSTLASQNVYQPHLTTRQWRTHVADKPIKELHVYVRPTDGGSDTYFNMRFGREGHTFDGRRVYLKHNGVEHATWQMNSRRAEGKELILNSYNGAVHVEKVVVVYDDHGRHDRHHRGHYDANEHYRADRHERYGSPHHTPAPHHSTGTVYEHREYSSPKQYGHSYHSSRHHYGYSRHYGSYSGSHYGHGTHGGSYVRRGSCGRY